MVRNASAVVSREERNYAGHPGPIGTWRSLEVARADPRSHPIAYQPLGKAIIRLHMLFWVRTEACVGRTQDAVVSSDRVVSNGEFESQPGGTRWSGVQQAARGQKRHTRARDHHMRRRLSTCMN